MLPAGNQGSAFGRTVKQRDYPTRPSATQGRWSFCCPWSNPGRGRARKRLSCTPLLPAAPQTPGAAETLVLLPLGPGTSAQQHSLIGFIFSKTSLCHWAIREEMILCELHSKKSRISEPASAPFSGGAYPGRTGDISLTRPPLYQTPLITSSDSPGLTCLPSTWPSVAPQSLPALYGLCPASTQLT